MQHVKALNDFFEFALVDRVRVFLVQLKTARDLSSELLVHPVVIEKLVLTLQVLLVLRHPWPPSFHLLSSQRNVQRRQLLANIYLLLKSFFWRRYFVRIFTGRADLHSSQRFLILLLVAAHQQREEGQEAVLVVFEVELGLFGIASGLLGPLPSGLLLNLFFAPLAHYNSVRILDTYRLTFCPFRSFLLAATALARTTAEHWLPTRDHTRW